MNRSYKIEEFMPKSYEVKLNIPLDAHDESHFREQMKAVDKWGNCNCHGKFLILVNHVLFTDSRDALIFKLKFG